MNQELWDLLRVNNNCRVNNHLNNKKGLKLIKKNQEDIEIIKKKLTKNILVAPSNAPVDGQTGGITDRPCPRKGDEVINNITGERFIYQNCVWNKAPCCFQTSTGVNDFVDTLENGNPGPQLVTPPATGGKFIWCQSGPGGTGNWVNEQPFDAKNILGTSGFTAPDSDPIFTPMNPVSEGDEWVAAQGYDRFIRQGGVWLKEPEIELTIETATGASSPATSSATIQLPDTIRIFSNGGIFAQANTGSVLLQMEPNILFCDAGSPPVSGPPNGDVFRPALFLDLASNVLNFWCPINTSWNEIASVSITGTDQNIDDIMTLTVGTGTVDLVQPPVTGGKFIWCQNGGGTGAWVPEDNFDARAWIGGDTGNGSPIAGTSNQLLGMTRAPIDGDKYANTALETKYTFDGGVWNVEPCCFNVSEGLTGQDIFLLGESSDNGIALLSSVVRPPSVGLTGSGKFIWCQDNSGATAMSKWVTLEDFDARSWIGGQTGFIGGSTGMLNGMTREPIEGDRYVRTFGLTGDNIGANQGLAYVFQNDMWVEEDSNVLLQSSVSDNDTRVLAVIPSEGVVDLATFVTPPSSTGTFLWEQQTLGTGIWIPQNDAFLSVRNLFTTDLPTGTFGPTGIVYSVIDEQDNIGYDNTTGIVTIQHTGTYLVNFSTLFQLNVNNNATGTYTIQNDIDPFGNEFEDIISDVIFDTSIGKTFSLSGSKTISLNNGDTLQNIIQSTINMNSAGAISNIILRSRMDVKKLL